jgi:Soluble lytic murein transglycosylase and related regulatory proteins (some contain LysM/invasin domains)
MKSVPVKIFLLFSILLISGQLSTIKAAGTSDTTILFAENRIPIAPPPTLTVAPRPSNVVYPACLESHRAETIAYIEKFSNRKRKYLINTYQKGKKYFPKVTAMLKRYQLPQELKVLLALESGFNGNAVSRAGAVGYWQIMDDVGKEYGLHIVAARAKASAKKKDERKNFNKSTLVAVKYLRDRCRNLDNDLLLMVAAYNCGVGNVWDAMKKSGKKNPDFWDIKKYLPAETRSYVMNFIALNVIFANYENFAKQQLVFNPVPPQEIEINNTPATVTKEDCDL